MTTIFINGQEFTGAIEHTGNRGNDINRAARRICRENAIDWKRAEVFARHGERGRCYTKQAGFETLGAHG